MARADNSESARNANARRRIIEDAQQLCHYMRAQCQEQRAFLGEVPEDYRIEFQNAIANYYWALRPLRNEPVVEDWWENVVLSEHWTDADEEEPYTGLELIAEVNRMTETVQYKSRSMRGTQVTTEKRSVALPFTILEDVSGTLDDAAGKLGFKPKSPDDDSLPMITDFDQSGETPTGNVKRAKYTRTPEI